MCTTAPVWYMNKWNWWKINHKRAIPEAAVAGHVIEISQSKRSTVTFYHRNTDLQIAVIFVSIFIWLEGKANPTWQQYSGGDTKQRSFLHIVYVYINAFTGGVRQHYRQYWYNTYDQEKSKTRLLVKHLNKTGVLSNLLIISGSLNFKTSLKLFTK